MKIDQIFLLDRRDKASRLFVKAWKFLKNKKDDLVFVSFRIADVRRAGRRYELCVE